MAFESTIVSFTIQKLGDALIEEAKFLSGVKGQVQSLQRELTWMQSYLIDVDAEQEEGDERLRTRITEIRRIAYDAEDVIDSFILDAATRKKESLLKRYACCLNFLVRTHKIGAQIEAIKSRIRESTEMLQKYGVGMRTGQVQKRGPRSYPYSNDDYVVGLEEDIETLVEKLTNIMNEANVLCIVGMGGSGKTTLARKLYNHKKIKQHFQCQVWVFVSQDGNAQDVLFEILRQVTGEKRKSDESWSMEELVEKLRHHLEQMLYLIVLDDVWKKEVLEEMLPAFPHGKEGSKIIVTTRNRENIRFPDLRCLVHEVRPLTEDEAWELFSRIALNHRHNMNNFEKLGKETLRKCDGLPLAVIALGGLLGAKDTVEEWEKMSKAVSTRVMEGRGTSEYGKVKDMLALSYRELPGDLKPCFLYLAHFPEDWEIRAGLLIRMWISEGFVTSQQLSEGETLEDAARRCLNELIQRCIVQVAARNYAGKVKAVRIHDLMRELCIKKAKEQDFLLIFSSESSSLGNGSAFHDDDGSMTQSRRSAIHSNSRNIPGLPTNSHLRSLSVFGEPSLAWLYVYYHGMSLETRVRLNLEPVCQNYRLLRVLNIVAVEISDIILPAEIGNLLHLRYLGIRGTNIRQLPESIGKLRNLLTLDYRITKAYCEITVPNVFGKLERLRHLFLPYDSWGDMKGLELHRLKYLKTLWGIRGGDWMLEEMSGLSPNIERLRIIGIFTKEQIEALSQCPSVISNHLHSLYLDWIDGPLDKVQNLDMISHCNSLRKLKLGGPLGDKSSAIQFPHYIEKLELWNSKVESQDTMAAFGRLPNLKLLSLSSDAYIGSEWTCSAGEFPQLEQLRLSNIYQLEEWRVEKGAMPSLKKLYINSCTMLKWLPEGLMFIDTFQELETKYMSESFKSRLQQGGEDLHIIQHIPTVRIGHY